MQPSADRPRSACNSLHGRGRAALAELDHAASSAVGYAEWMCGANVARAKHATVHYVGVMRALLHVQRRGALVAFAVMALVATLAGPSQAETTAGAKALESRLHAPCCYQGTLDIHDSDLARSLRSEIESRLAGGESTESVQADFVARYGDKVVAARSDAPIRGMAIAVVLASLVAAASLAMVVRRWSRRERGGVAIASSSTRDALDDRIDADLAEIDAS